MASIVLTDEEWSVLANEPHQLLKLYIELRRRMDFGGSRIVGLYPRVNEQSLKEALYIEPRPGRKVSGSPTRKEYRHAIEALIALGLLRPLPHRGPLVFELPMAYVEESAQKQWGPNGARMGPDLGPDFDGNIPQRLNDLDGAPLPNGAKGFADYPSQRGQPLNPEPCKKSKAKALLVDGAVDPDESGDDQVKPKTNGIPPCPHQQIIDLYHEMLPTCPKVIVWNDTRKAHLRQRWREAPDLDDWRFFFAKVARSQFLTGRAPSRDPNRKPFVASLEWLIKPTNWAKVIEGAYS